MSRPGRQIQVTDSAVSAPAHRTDSGIHAAAGVTVVALAGIAEAISYSHMRELAAAHGETGCQAHTFPVSVDGIEIVASLVLLADRCTCDPPTGCLGPRWQPGPPPVSRPTWPLRARTWSAGWWRAGPRSRYWWRSSCCASCSNHAALVDRPAISDARPAPADSRPPLTHAGGDDLGTVAASLPPSPLISTADGHCMSSSLADGNVGLVRPASGVGRLGHPREGTAPGGDPGTGRPDETEIKPGMGNAGHRGTGTASDIADVAGLLPAARAVRDRLQERDDSLTRDSLAAALRREGTRSATPGSRICSRS